MKRKILTTGKKAMALALALLTMTTTGCGTKTPDDNAESESATFESITEAAADNSDVQEAGKDITLTTYYYTSKKDDVVRATGQYTDITFSDDIKAQYPKLVEAVDEMTANWETYISEGVGEFASWYDEEFDDGMEFTNEQNVDILRFDDRMFTILEGEYSYAGGAHPNHSTSFYNFDPVTGNAYDLRDVLRNPDEFPAAIRAWLEKTYPETLEEIDSFYFEDGDVFEDKLNEGTYNFSVDDKGLHIMFSPYEVASYAAGFIGVDFFYEDYPDMVLDSFKMDAPADMESRINHVEAGTTEVEAKSIEYENYENEYASVTVENPTWDYYFNDYYKKDNERHYLSLTKTKENTTDWLDTEKWAADHGFTFAKPDYSDETYNYIPYDPVEYDYMYNALSVSTVADNVIVCDYDLSAICNGPDQKETRNSDMTEYLRYAKIVDDILYVEVGHWGYSSEGPDNAYIVAIDLNTNEVIFRTQPLVANGYNFLVVDDTIICGYGFTAEPDFIYLLDRYDGTVKEKIPVKSSPFQFALEGDTLYVATYNTEYEFKVTR